MFMIDEMKNIVEVNLEKSVLRPEIPVCRPEIPGTGNSGAWPEI